MKWRIQRVPCRGCSQIGSKRRIGRVREREPTLVGGGPGASPGNFFNELMQLVHSEPIFGRIRVHPSSTPNCVRVLLSKLRYTGCGRNFHFSCRGSYYKAKEDSVLFFCSRGGGRISQRKFLKNGCKRCITPICELITELDFITDFDFITKFWRFP